MTADWVQGDGSLQDRLALADWRRRVAALYVEVRAMADPAVAVAHWRAAREWLFREHPQSPLPIAERAGSRARHFDHDPKLRFSVPVEPAPAEDPATLSLELPNSGSDSLSFRRIGVVRVPLPGGEQRLSVFWLAGYAGGLFIPFRDATNGRETYGAGRYLVDAAKSHDLGTVESTGELILATSTSRPSRRARSIRAGHAHWHRRRTGSTSRCGLASGCRSVRATHQGTVAP